jgi:hypothetical protein
MNISIDAINHSLTYINFVGIDVMPLPTLAPPSHGARPNKPLVCLPEPERGELQFAAPPVPLPNVRGRKGEKYGSYEQ